MHDQGIAELLAAREHRDALQRGAIRVNDQRTDGVFSVLLPDAHVTGRWITIREFDSSEAAEAFAAGYCYRRDDGAQA